MPNEYGITAKEATEALTAAMRLLPPPGKEDIELIKRNPTFSCLMVYNRFYSLGGFGKSTALSASLKPIH